MTRPTAWPAASAEWTKIPMKDRRMAVLKYMKGHPNVRTDDLAKALGSTVPQATTVLLWLLEKKKVGRQRPLESHEYVSTWTAEAEA